SPSHASAPLTIVHYVFFFNVTPTTLFYTLSLHDALPISFPDSDAGASTPSTSAAISKPPSAGSTPTSPPSPNSGSPKSCATSPRSEEHTSELQSRENLVCRLLLEKKNTETRHTYTSLNNI